MRTFTIIGTYTTAGKNYTTSELTPDGRWLALRAQGQANTATTIALVDTQAGKLFKTIQLHGNFDLDAISPDGNRIYLLERDSDQPGHYYVRRFDIDQNQLLNFNIVDKTVWNDSMSGSALTRRMAQDGKVAYTLYTDESTLYAANSALGVIVAIDVRDSDVVFNDTIKGVNYFAQDSISGSGHNTPMATQGHYNGAVISPDQRTLYFVGTHGIWSADTVHLAVKNHYAIQQTFTSLAISTDGRTLYAISPLQGVMLVNTTSGAVQQVNVSAAHTPGGIVWISQ
jgi:dipeptidyl aminopeptidase/acylaminoacyl peptidase